MERDSVGFQKILVVDDEPSLRNVLKNLLGSVCEEVIAVGTVAEALVCLQDGVDLVITDVRLGQGSSGIEVARAAASRHPAPPVIAISGYADSSDGLELGKAGVAAFVAKPFTPIHRRRRDPPSGRRRLDVHGSANALHLSPIGFGSSYH